MYIHSSYTYISLLSSMEGCKSIINRYNDDDEDFFDAFELLFQDCPGPEEPGQSISISSPVSQLEADSEVSITSKLTPEFHPPNGLRLRRLFSQHVRKDTPVNDSEDSDFHSSVSLDTTIRAERKYRFSPNLEENERECGKPDSFRVRVSSDKAVRGAKEECKENSTITTADEDSVNKSVAVDLGSGGTDESSSYLLLVLAGFLIKAIGFQLRVLASLFTFPIWLYMFVIDPRQAVRHGKEYLIEKSTGIWVVICESCVRFVGEWLKEQKSVRKLAVQVGWAFLWASCVCFVLVGLFASAFVASGLIMRRLVEEPIHIKETLIFDYTKISPVAFVPIQSCPSLSHDVNCREKSEVGKVEGLRVIPPKHRFEVTVSLTLPQSDYNRNLGIFQVRVDLLAANGSSLASSSYPCMLQFKSQPIRLLSTFLNVGPLVAGYAMESQTIKIKFRGFTERDIPTACLRVMIEQRVEFQPGSGIPEIYDASLNLKSELPLLKWIIWYRKKSIFIWIAITMFAMELPFALLCFRFLVMRRLRPRDASASNDAPPNQMTRSMVADFVASADCALAAVISKAEGRGRL